MRRTLALFGTSLLAALTAFAVPTLAPRATAGTTGSAGAVYVMTNDAHANAVIGFDRDANGSLTETGTFATGGRGTGAGLGSQGSLILSADGAWLFAVNAGSNSISSFAVEAGGLQLVGVFGSRGLHPISLTQHASLLYVLNGGGVANIAGFRIGADGSLSSIGGSKQTLSNPAPNPAEVAFNQAGSLLMVTEKSTQILDTFPVDGTGRAGPRTSVTSAGIEPFGFAFDTNDHAIVSEAFNGGPGRSAVSSYQVSGTDLKPISASVPTTQTAACWVVIGQGGRYAYTSNTGSGTISSVSIAGDGTLSLAQAAAASTGPHSAPIDEDLSAGGSYLYVLTSGLGTITKLDVDGAGLSNLRMFGSLPPSASGLAAS
jgi:6-phosphogluconolactonase (cycloisomerase 2 family)